MRDWFVLMASDGIIEDADRNIPLMFQTIKEAEKEIKEITRNFPEFKAKIMQLDFKELNHE